MIDDDTARALLRRTLAAEGYDVITAEDSPRGIELARQVRPLAITLDVVMTGMDGWDVLRELKADEGLRNIPVVRITVLEDRNHASALGASEFLAKPVSRPMLRDMLGRLEPVSGTQSVLVVEDDDAARDIISRVMSDAGWQVHQAVNGREAIDLLDELRPSLILLDLMMPEMDGFEFLTRAQSFDFLADTPIVVITAADLSAEDHEHLNGRCHGHYPEDIDRARRVGRADRETHQPRPGGRRARCLIFSMSRTTRTTSYMLTRRLTRKGFEIVTAGNGEDAIGMAARKMPDLILMDLSLPVLDGWEATRRIKAQAETAARPSTLSCSTS